MLVQIKNRDYKFQVGDYIIDNGYYQRILFANRNPIKISESDFVRIIGLGIWTINHNENINKYFYIGEKSKITYGA